MKPLSIQLNNSVRIDKTKETAVIIVSCYNQFDYTLRCIESIIKNKDDSYNYILYIFDDNSSEDETELFFRDNIDNLNIKCKYFKYKKNHQLTQSWNDGINHSFRKDGADYIILLNNDTFTTPYWAKNMLDFLKHGKIDIIGPLTNDMGAHRDYQKVSYYFPGQDLDEDSFKILKAKTKDKQIKVEEISGFCMALSKKLLNSVFFDKKEDYINYFDPSFINYENEIEFIHRCKKKGFSPYIALNSFVYHYHSKSKIKTTRDFLKPDSEKNIQLNKFLSGLLIQPYPAGIKDKYPFKLPTWRIDQFIRCYESYKELLENNEKDKAKKAKAELGFYLGLFYKILHKEFKDILKDVDFSKDYFNYEYISEKINLKDNR
ncbi:glycosyltransferase [Candidatus Woesearchaeota archaeon]|nr:glycosyltransferase [Candidatus Woesearchaeota archaeon]